MLKRRCDVIPTQNDAAITPRVGREWHVIYKDISNSTWITCVSMRVIRSPEAYAALNSDVLSNPDINVCRSNVGPTHIAVRGSYSLLVMRISFSCQSHHQCKYNNNIVGNRVNDCQTLQIRDNSSQSMFSYVIFMSTIRQYSHTQNNVPIKIIVEN